MDAREYLGQHIDQQQGRLAAGVIPDRETALLALVEAIDADGGGSGADPGRVTARHPAGLGALSALRFCLDAPASGNVDPATWAGEFLARCRDLDTARLVAWHADSGEMRLASTAEGRLDAWPSGRNAPASWQERADIAWWARRLARDVAVPASGFAGTAMVEGMRYQLPYPSGAVVGGVPVGALEAALAKLIDRLDAEPPGGTLVVDERALIADVARGDVGPEVARWVVTALTLDTGNAAWHATLPGGPLAPLVRIGHDRLACSRRGLLGEPGFFALRELRRRDPEDYHNAAHLREDAFREDLYACLADRRFVTSPGRIVLRRDDRRNRTDVDAAVFDRKTGTLAVFELKAQDPLARTLAEHERQAENLRRAGHQVAAVLDWIARNGADEVLSRIDRAVAKRFRVHRVVAFVLGRYAAQFGTAKRNGRVAWGSWPGFLRALEGAGNGNPLLSAHTRLLHEESPAWTLAEDASPAEIVLGEARLTIWPSWAAMQARRERE